MSDADERGEKPAFTDHRNITIGKGRIIFAPSNYLGTDSVWVQPGWVLPSGRRTQDQIEACEAAAAIDKLSR